METCSGDDNNNNTFVKIDCVMKNHVIDEHKEYLSKHYDIAPLMLRCMDAQ